ncbi:MAG: AraC family transcriptional regulator [Spirochaetota bacterium]
MNHNRMVELLSSLVPEEGVIQNVIEGVDLFRITSSTPRTPVTYSPAIIILAQGQKKLFIGDDIVIYDPLNYLVLSVPLPMECETTASAEKPLMGVKIKVDTKTIGEILLAIDNDNHNMTSLPKGIHSVPLDEQIINATIRLLESLHSLRDRRFLGPIIVKEIIYRVLCGEKGGALMALAYRNKHFFQIARILDKIHESYIEKLDINSLAHEAGMSISAFHDNFKKVTNMTPLQYIKNVRLHKARILMMEEGISAYSAAYHVGYESPSQFNREYKRLFGITPGKDSGKKLINL